MHNYFRMDGVLEYYYILAPDRHGWMCTTWLKLTCEIMAYLTTCKRRCNIFLALWLSLSRHRAGQAYPYPAFGFCTGMACALTLSLVGRPPLSLTRSFVHPVALRSVLRRSTYREAIQKRKPVTQESFPTHLPPSSDLPKDLLLVNALIATCLLTHG